MEFCLAATKEARAADYRTFRNNKNGKVGKRDHALLFSKIKVGQF